MAEAKFTIRASDKTKAAFKSVNAGLKRIGRNAGFAGAAAAAGLGVMIKSSLASADALAKTADKLGITTKALSGLQHAAALTGVEQSTLNKALVKQQKAIFDANRGLATYKQHFDALNLSTEDLMRLSPDEQFIAISEALNKVENQTIKTSIAYDIFGGRGTALINTLALGEDGLRGAADEAEALGVAISRIDAAKIEAANDSFHRSQQAIKGVGLTLTSNLAPAMKVISDRFVESAKTSNGWTEEVLSGIESIVNAVAIMADAWHAMKLVLSAVKLGAASMLSEISIGIAWIDEAISEFLNKIPGLDIKPSYDLQIWADATKLAVHDAAKELDNLLQADRPSDGIKATFAEIKEEAKAAAEEIAKIKPQGSSNVDELEGPLPQTDKETEADQKAADKREVALEALRMQFASEEEIEAEAFVRRNEIIELNAETEEQRKELLLQNHAKYMKRLGKITDKGLSSEEKMWKSSWQGKMKVTSGVLGSLSVLMESKNKEMFEVGKAAAISQTIMDTISGAQSAFTALSGIPYVGPFLGAAAAAAAIISGMARVNQIKSQSFGKGGSVSSSSGGSMPSTSAGGPAVGGGAAPYAGPEIEKIEPVNITLSLRDDELLNADGLRTLMDRIYDETEVAGYTSGVRISIA